MKTCIVCGKEYDENVSNACPECRFPAIAVLGGAEDELNEFARQYRKEYLANKQSDAEQSEKADGGGQSRDTDCIDLTATVEGVRDTLQAMTRHLAALSDEKRRLEQVQAALTRQCQEQISDCDQLTQNVAKLTGLQQQLTQKRDALSQHQSTLTTANNQLTANVGNLQNAVQQLVRQQADLTQQQTDLAQQRQSLITANNQLTANVRNLQDAVQQLVRRQADLTQQSQELDTEIAQLAAEVGELRRANDEKTARRQQLEDGHKAGREADRLPGYDERLEELSRKLKRLKETAQNLREDTQYLEIRGDGRPFALEPALAAGVKQSEKMIEALRAAIRDYQTNGCN